jgi:hypothetical protein
MPDLEALRAVDARLAAGEIGVDVDYAIDAIFLSHRGLVALNRKLAGDTPRYTTSLDAAMVLVPDEWAFMVWVTPGAETWAEAWPHTNPIKKDESTRTPRIAAASKTSPAAALTLAIVRAHIALLENADACHRDVQ